jgi:hypothetical protein
MKNATHGTKLELWFVHCRDADKSLARPRRKQANVSVRMTWISFGALPCRKKQTWWQLASQCCWNRAPPWHASELISFLLGLRTYQHPGIFLNSLSNKFPSCQYLNRIRNSNAEVKDLSLFAWNKTLQTYKIPLHITLSKHLRCAKYS